MLFNLLRLKYGWGLLINVNLLLSLIKSINFFLTNLQEVKHENSNEVNLDYGLEFFNKVSPTAEIDQPHKTLTPGSKHTT